MSDSNATERFTTLCAMLTEFEDAAMAIRIEAFDTQARDEVWRNAISDLAQRYATEIEAMFTPEQAALNKAAGKWAHADGLLRGLLEECEECPDTGCTRYIEKVVKPNMRKADA